MSKRKLNEETQKQPLKTLKSKIIISPENAEEHISRLFQAINDNNFEYVQNILEDYDYKPYINSIYLQNEEAEFYNHNLLTYAIFKGSDKCLNYIKLLIESGADTNIADGNNYTSLNMVSKCGNVEGAKILINNNAEIKSSSKDDRYHPLVSAIEGHHPEIVRLLLDNYTNIDKTLLFNNDDYMTSLEAAAYLGYCEIAKILIDGGADVNKGVDSPPIIQAIREGNIDIVQLLINSNVDLKKSGTEALELAMKEYHKAVVYNNDGYSVVCLQILEILLNTHRINIKDEIFFERMLTEHLMKDNLLVCKKLFQIAYHFKNYITNNSHNKSGIYPIKDSDIECIIDNSDIGFITKHVKSYLNEQSEYQNVKELIEGFLDERYIRLYENESEIDDDKLEELKKKYAKQLISNITKDSKTSFEALEELIADHFYHDKINDLRTKANLGKHFQKATLTEEQTVSEEVNNPIDIEKINNELKENYEPKNKLTISNAVNGKEKLGKGLILKKFLKDAKDQENAIQIYQCLSKEILEQMKSLWNECKYIIKEKNIFENFKVFLTKWSKNLASIEYIAIDHILNELENLKQENKNLKKLLKDSTTKPLELEILKDEAQVPNESSEPVIHMTGENSLVIDEEVFSQ